MNKMKRNAMSRALIAAGLLALGASASLAQTEMGSGDTISPPPGSTGSGGTASSSSDPGSALADPNNDPFLSGPDSFGTLDTLYPSDQ